MTDIEVYYRQGFIDALRAFAYWKDGEEYVGSCGTTLKEALKNIKTNWYYKNGIEFLEDLPEGE